MNGQIPVFRQKQASPPPALAPDTVEELPFVIVGSGPVGLAAALDLAQKGHQVTLVTAFEFIAAGSKGICYAKQTLDIFDRLGILDRVINKGVTWNIGKLFWQDADEPIYQFDMLPVKNQKNPGFVNIQQYYIEDYLVDELEALENVDIRWGHKVTDIAVAADTASLDIETVSGSYTIRAGYVLACDGSRSTIREAMDLDFKGRVFEDNFLIADIKLKTPHPSERWFWFDPPFCKGGTALLHKQPDDVWRCDFQLGWDIDRESAIHEENVEPLIRGMFGEQVEFSYEWLSIYTFQCRRMERFVHGPVIFVGDSAHLVSPFGARGANSGIADAENIAWKLDLVLKGEADPSLIESYNQERVQGADENIMNSSRSTDFMTPKNAQSQAFRDAVLELSDDHAFARPFINSGRLSLPTPYSESALSTPDDVSWAGGISPGHPCVDAPLGGGEASGPWLLEQLGNRFVVLHFGDAAPDTGLDTVILPRDGLAADRYDAGDGATYLIRPDQVVAARWKNAAAGTVQTAAARASGGQAQ